MKEDPSAYDTNKKRRKVRTLHVILSEKKEALHKSRLAVDIVSTDPYFDLSLWNTDNVTSVKDMFTKGGKVEDFKQTSIYKTWKKKNSIVRGGTNA